MNRTRRFYQDHMATSVSDMGLQGQGHPVAFVFPDKTEVPLPTRSERRISGGERPTFTSLESPRRMESTDGSQTPRRYGSFRVSPNCAESSSTSYSRSTGRTSGGYGGGHHRRTPSNSSTSGYYRTTPSEVATSEDYSSWGPPASSDYTSPSSATITPVRRISRQNSYNAPTSTTTDLERPQTLELPLTPRTPLRSSLRKNSSYTATNRYPVVGGSSGGTPTNPTPPDSLSEDTFNERSSGTDRILGTSRSDSGFVSTSNRVRFSPSPFEKTGAYVTDWSPTHEQHRTPSSTTSSSAKSPFPVQRHNRNSNSSTSGGHHYITERDLQRDFDLHLQN